MKRNTQPHVSDWKGSVSFSKLFTDRPAFSTTQILIQCQFISSWCRSCNTDPGVEGTKITDWYPPCVNHCTAGVNFLQLVSPGDSNCMVDTIMGNLYMTPWALCHHRWGSDRPNLESLCILWKFSCKRNWCIEGVNLSIWLISTFWTMKNVKAVLSLIIVICPVKFPCISLHHEQKLLYLYLITCEMVAMK